MAEHPESLHKLEKRFCTNYRHRLRIGRHDERNPGRESAFLYITGKSFTGFTYTPRYQKHSTMHESGLPGGPLYMSAY